MGNNVVPALCGVSLEIAAGEFVAVMGPSGSGKSTFMNLLGCLDHPSGGATGWTAQEVSEALRRRTGGSAQPQARLRLPAFQPARAHLGPGQRRAAPALQRHAAGERKRAERRLAQVGLAERMDHHPAQLSGGQQQRVAIARALVNDPQLVLADEPTGALDSRTSVEIMALLQQLNREGITIVLVTHEHDVANFAGRIISFRDGRVIQDTPNAGQCAADLLR
jgi:putative ABC transport system ATP-binding protein